MLDTISSFKIKQNIRKTKVEKAFPLQLEVCAMSYGSQTGFLNFSLKNYIFDCLSVLLDRKYIK
jgi:hypothetical protein